MKNTHKGFTLIELLVVVGIIGILATITIASLNGARGKARDAKRISDVKQLSLILETEESSSPSTALTGCVGQNALTTACTNAGDIADAFGKFKDPSPVANSVCSTASSEAANAAAANKVPCNYTISKLTGAPLAGAAAATTDAYQLCFWLESGSGDLKKGLNSVTNGGQFYKDANGAGGCR